MSIENNQHRLITQKVVSRTGICCHGGCCNSVSDVSRNVSQYQRSQDLIQSRMAMCHTTVATVLSGQCDGVMA